jgi:DUF1680 family protein
MRDTVIPYQWEAINDRIPDAPASYSMHNFRAAAGLEEGGFKGPVFQDHDWFTWIEAVGYVLSSGRDPALEKIADESIDVVCAAQREDGYLNTYYILNGLEKRWTNLMENHELFNLGHFIEGAIAYSEATGKNKILLAARKYADLACKTLGPGPDQIHGYPGHELVEMALVKLYDVTSEKRYLDLAEYFINQRGREPLYFWEEHKKPSNDAGFDYFQAGRPVREQKEVTGHAVRAVYLYSGMADIARKTRDPSLFEACERMWDDITEKKLYITGSVGASSHGEAFGAAYDLPNDTIYGETCAAIGLFFFAHRMLLLEADVKYADVMEKCLYNGILSGISLDGTRFFYVNPLEVNPEADKWDHTKSHVKHERQKWFGCACCPPNIARLLASLGKYAFTLGENGGLFLHLYEGGIFSHSVKGTNVELEINSTLPWNEDASIKIKAGSPVSFALNLRIPGWARGYKIAVNGEPVPGKPSSGKLSRGYLTLDREWKNGDEISIRFEMPVIVNTANPVVRKDLHKAAVSRGPLVYCLEEADNGKDLHLVSLGDKPNFTVHYREELLGGVAVIKSESLIYDKTWQGKELYAEAGSPRYLPKPLTWIPYYAWANRGIGEMKTWIWR